MKWDSYSPCPYDIFIKAANWAFRGVKSWLCFDPFPVTWLESKRSLSKRVKWSILWQCSSLIETLDSMLNPENVISLTAYNEEGKFWSSVCNANKPKSENRFLPSSPKYSFRICTLFCLSQLLTFQIGRSKVKSTKENKGFWKSKSRMIRLSTQSSKKCFIATVCCMKEEEVARYRLWIISSLLSSGRWRSLMQPHGGSERWWRWWQKEI